MGGSWPGWETKIERRLPTHGKIRDIKPLFDTPAIQPPPSSEPAPACYANPAELDHAMKTGAHLTASGTKFGNRTEPLFRHAKPAPADLRPVVGIVDERYLKAPSTLGERVKRAQAECETWSPEKRRSVRLEGGGKRPINGGEG
jgi:hypothetical protein